MVCTFLRKCEVIVPGVQISANNDDVQATASPAVAGPIMSKLYLFNGGQYYCVPDPLQSPAVFAMCRRR